MGNCVSSLDERPSDLGISSQSLGQNNKKVKRFHDTSAPSNNYKNARKAKVIKRSKKIHKAVIGLPSNFQHTGHIGIAEIRCGKFDPEKIKNQMAEVAAALHFEMANTSGSSIPSSPGTKLTSSSLVDNLSQDSQSNFSSAPSTPTTPTSFQFHVKRKPTLSSISAQIQQSPTPSLQPINDPIAEITAALKMPYDGNFDLVKNKSTTLIM